MSSVIAQPLLKAVQGALDVLEDAFQSLKTIKNDPGLVFG